jgi:MFS family permease
VGIFIAAAGFFGFLLGALISAALGALAVVLLVRDGWRRRHGWWAFGIIGVPILACLLLLVHSRPRTLNLPNSIDLMGFFLNCVGYTGSPGVAAAIASVVTLAIPRPKRNAVPPPVPSSQ